MDRNLVKIIQNRAEMAIKKAFADDPMLSHLAVGQKGGKIGEIDATLSFSFTDTSAKNKVVLAGEIHEKTLHMGKASAGTIIVFGNKEYIVVRARRVKYEAVCKKDGKIYILPFKGCRFATVTT